LTLQMLGVFSEYERAKIIERTTRGRLHRLRMGEMSSNGHRIYGYHYVKKSPVAPASLVINEEQAAIARQIFEMFASGHFGLVTISRFLEERRIPTRTGRSQWNRDQIKFMLKNETYTGTRYYNRITSPTPSSSAAAASFLWWAMPGIDFASSASNDTLQSRGRFAASTSVPCDRNRPVGRSDANDHEIYALYRNRN
jgi:hypothetical protein